MKGILRVNPPLPRYQETWDVDVVLKSFDFLPNKDLFLKLLSKKLAMLLAIAAPKRVSEIGRIANQEKYFMQIISRTQNCVWWIVNWSIASVQNHSETEINQMTYC